MDIDLLISELSFKAVRSSGPGGQHVNKTASKVEVYFRLLDSQALSENQKDRIYRKLESKISSEGLISVQSSETRSQHKNKALAIEKLLNMLQDSLKVSKVRRRTKPSKSAMDKRVKSKKQQALKKTLRKPPSH